MTQSFNFQRRLRWAGACLIVLIAVSSWSVGATRTRGGLLRALGLDFLAFGHSAALLGLLGWVGIFGLLFVWVRLGRLVRDGLVPLGEVVRTLVWWVVPWIVAAPLSSRDVYSYLIQGTLVRDGFNPYKDFAVSNPGPMLFEVSPDWRNTTTPYGPLHLWIGKVITMICGDSVDLGVLAYKVLSILGFAVTAWAVVKICQEFSADAGFALWIGLLNPLTLFHCIGGMHNESTMVAFTTVAILAALRRRFVFACILIGLATAVKATGFIVLPFIVWLWLRADNHPKASVRQGFVPWLGRAIAAIGATVGSLCVVTFATGLTFGWVAELSGNSKVINLLAFPSLISGFLVGPLNLVIKGVSFNSVLETARPVSLVIMLVLLAIVWLRYRDTKPQIVEGVALAYLVTCVFNTVTLPWYYLPGLVLVGTWTPSVRVIRATICASIIVAASFMPSGNNWMYNWTYMGLIFVYTAVLYLSVYQRWTLTDIKAALYGSQRLVEH